MEWESCGTKGRRGRGKVGEMMRWRVGREKGRGRTGYSAGPLGGLFVVFRLWLVCVVVPGVGMDMAEEVVVETSARMEARTLRALRDGGRIVTGE